MKKTIVFIALFAFFGKGIQAQDTVNSNGLLPQYFTGGFPDFKARDSVVFSSMIISQAGWNDVAFPMNAGSDTLSVYGIVAAMITYPEYGSGTMLQVYYNRLSDTTYTNVIEYLRLYQKEQGVISQVGEDLPVHIKTTPVTYYLNTGFVGVNGTPWPLVPMYERYFSTPQTVTANFLVGRTSQCALPTDNKPYATHPVEFASAEKPGASAGQTINHLYVGETNSIHVTGHWYDHVCLGQYFLIFPILTPEPTIDTTVNPGSDTTFVGGDTVAMGDTLIVTDTVIIGGDTIVNYDTLLAVVQNDLLQRLTAVTPNPAVGTARVVASTGLSRIVAYNTAGSKVYDRPATGLSATLDVSRWPSGTYLLRIHTPLGTVTKKLIVK